MSLKVSDSRDLVICHILRQTIEHGNYCNLFKGGLKYKVSDVKVFVFVRRSSFTDGKKPKQVVKFVCDRCAWSPMYIHA